MKINFNRKLINSLTILLLATAAYIFSGCGSGSGILEVAVFYAGSPIPLQAEVPVDVDVPTCGPQILSESVIVDMDSRGLRNVVLRLEGELESKEPAVDITISNKGCVFVPHVAVAMIGSKINIRNNDPVFHTTDTYINGKRFFNIPLLVGQPPPPPKTIEEAGLIEITCAVHKWMQGYIVVHTNPYIGITDESGIFSMTGIPPGNYSYVAWHEELGEKKGEVEIKRGQVSTLRLEFGDVLKPGDENQFEAE